MANAGFSLIECNQIAVKCNQMAISNTHRKGNRTLIESITKNFGKFRKPMERLNLIKFDCV